MDRKQLLKRVDWGWTAFRQSFQGVPHGALLQPVVVGEWSVKDLIDHAATWEDSRAALYAMMQGRSPLRYVTYGGIDAFNHAQRLLLHDAPLSDALQRSDAVHARLLTFLSDVPWGHFAAETRFRRLRLDSYRHYREHQLHVLAWRQARGP